MPIRIALLSGCALALALLRPVPAGAQVAKVVRIGLAPDQATDLRHPIAHKLHRR